MFLLALAASSSLVCHAPQVRSGDSLHCAGAAAALRLYGIDTSAPLAACAKPGSCSAGPTAAARDHLANLLRGRSVTCKRVDGGSRRYLRADCSADEIDLSCAMARDGYAVTRFALPNCDPSPATRILVLDGAEIHVPPILQRWWRVIAGIFLANIIAFAAMSEDKLRADRGRKRISELFMLLLAVLGGSIGTVAAQLGYQHKKHKQPFAALLLLIVGVQTGMAAGVIALELLRS